MKNNDVKSRIDSALSQHIVSGDVVILAISGGPDSTFLLHALVEFSGAAPFQIIVAHVNHGIRGHEADQDEKFVKNLAEKFGFKFEVKRVKLAGKNALEERGRNIRREFFEALRKKYRARWVLTAHTQDDNIETIVFNFLRGSGLKGLAGMKVVNDFYLKPLLDIPKSEILKFLCNRKIKFCNDKTNKDTKFRRNFIREKLMPNFKKINPFFGTTILRNSEIFRELDDFVRLQAQQFLTQHKAGDVLFPLKEYETLPNCLKAAVIQEAFKICSGDAAGLALIKTWEIRRLLSRRIGNKKIILPNKGWFLLKKGGLMYNSICF